MTSRAITYDAIFEVMSKASCGVQGSRLDIDDDGDIDDPITKLGVALNVLLDDLEYRSAQAEANLNLLLAERDRRLREADEALCRREEFISIAAHEIYTPLTSLNLVLQSVSQGMMGPLSETLRHALRLAQRQSRKLVNLVDALLNVARSQSNAPMALQREHIDLATIAGAVAELFAPDLQRSASELTIHSEQPVVGYWDRNRIEQALTNLLGNAIKFGEGKPIEITIAAHEDTARVTVADYGIGIPRDRLDRVFERFERGVSSAHYGGLGLGLSIVREIVSAHGGSVRAESVVGEGTTFIVELPCGGPPSDEKP